MPAPKRRLLAVIFGLIVFLALLLPYLHPHPTPRYTVTDLGVLPGDTESCASGINNHGDIVGFSINASYTQQQLFLVRGDRMISLGLYDSHSEYDGPAINDSGKINRKQRIGSAASPAGYEQSLPHHAVLYGGSRKVDFTLPPGWTMANLSGVNGLGQVVGTCRRLIIGSRSRAAFVYDSKTRKFLMLPLPPGFQGGGFPEGINDHGQIAGFAWQPGYINQAVLWNAGQPVLLTGLRGMNDSRAEAVNNQGEVVGTAWSEPNAAAQFVNDHNIRLQLLVPVFQKQWKNRAVVYKSGKAQDLNTLIPEDADWTLEEANSINDRGQIVGNGLHHGQQRAFLLTPVH